MRTVRAFPALLAAVVVVLAGCGQARGGSSSTTASDFPAGSYAGRLAFFGAGPDDATSGALVLDLATGERVRVGGSQEAWSTAWVGPDRLAVVSGAPRIRGDGGPGTLVLAAVDGSGQETPVGDVADVLEVAASADGQHMAFLGRTQFSSGACLEAPPAARMGVYLAAGDASAVRRVADVPAATSALALSPDGATVAVLDHGDDTTIPAGRDWCSPGDQRLVLIDTATGTSRAVAEMSQIVERPRFSPDGATLVMAGAGSAMPGSDVVLVDVATATARRIATPDTSERAPTFSPDGQQIAVLRTQGAGGPGSAGSIAVGSADGTGLRTVATTGTDDQDLAWSPDGSALVVAGAVVTPACGGAEGADDDGGAMGGCDVFTATSNVRIVDAGGGQLRQVSETVSGEAGLTFAP